MVAAATDTSGGGGTVDSSQVLISNYINSLSGPITSGCKYEVYDDDDAENTDYQFFVFYVNCPLLSNRAVSVSFTDTIQGWENTVEHCANVLTKVTESTGSGGTPTYITKEYAVWGPAKNPTVAFYRSKPDSSFTPPPPL